LEEEHEPISAIPSLLSEQSKDFLLCFSLTKAPFALVDQASTLAVFGKSSRSKTLTNKADFTIKILQRIECVFGYRR